MKNSWITNTLLVAALSVGASSAGAVGLTVTPNIITNDYVGKITVTITGLTSGQAVVLEKFGDFNTNGVIDAGEPLLNGGLIFDGAPPAIGGVRNLNVPGDDDGATNGQVRVELFYPGVDKGIDLVAGKYLVKMSDPADGFPPITNLFEIRQKVFSRGATGRITASGTGTPLANAMVVMMPPDSSPVAGAVTDANGNYTLYGPPGNYIVLPLILGYVSDFSGALTVSAGSFASLNLALAAADRTISGRVKDSSNAAGIPGAFVQAESGSGQFASSFSQRDGTYSLSVLGGSWDVEISSGSLAQSGYLGWQAKTNINAASGSVANFDLPVDRATALIYGSLKDNQNNPLVGIDIWSGEQNQQYDTSGSTYPTNAKYCVGVRPGSWWVGPDSDALTALGYVSQGTIATVTANQAFRADFVVTRVTARLIGRVVDNFGAPVGDIGFSASDHQGIDSNVNTDGNGNFNIGVAAGTWYLQVSTEASQARQLVGPQLPVTLMNGETRSNIVVIVYRATNQISGTIRDNNVIPLSNLGVGCFLNLNGTNYTSYVQTTSDGHYQMPVFNGLWQVWLACDGLRSRGYNCANNVETNIAGGNVTLNFTVESPQPLQLTTNSLAGGTVGVYYDQSVEAVGGEPPYWCWLPGGTVTLPPGTSGNMSFSSDGSLSGFPGTAGIFSFEVGVSDSASPPNVMTQMISITIQAAGSPLQVTTTFLPNAQQGASYTTQLQASGGQLPYSWSMAPGSLSLPPDLNLSTGGVISGTPASNGTFAFIVQVTDANFTLINRSLNLTINSKPMLTALNRTGNQFQLRLAGTIGQNYTIEFATNPAGSNWFSLLTTNPSSASVTILDSTATNTARFYRARVGP